MPVLWWDSTKAEDGIERAAFIGLLEFGNLVHEEAVRRIQSPPKSGRIYRRRGVEHQASAPGESPATDTGRLAQSGDVIPQPDRLVVTVKFSHKAAMALEKGTRKMAPRPFLGVSLLTMQPQGVAAVQTALEAYFGSAT